MHIQMIEKEKETIRLTIFGKHRMTFEANESPAEEEELIGRLKIENFFLNVSKQFCFNMPLFVAFIMEIVCFKRK